MADSSESTRTDWWGQFLASLAWKGIPGWVAKGGNKNALRISRGTSECWLVLYREAPARGRQKIGALIRFMGEQGAENWEYLRRLRDAGEVRFPEHVRFSHKVSGWAERWNIVVDRELAQGEIISDRDAFEWLARQATDLSSIVDAHVPQRTPR